MPEHAAAIPARSPNSLRSSGHFVPGGDPFANDGTACLMAKRTQINPDRLKKKSENLKKRALNPGGCTHSTIFH